ncbi:hypothetical protein [Maritalea sp.]|uniref:hypothetical protein n=1 Tax=Maritalea sp. TaxID=2003361 RepID=UPI003EF5D1A0
MDALSTIVMVVTFLLIVLGVVIFGISQQIAKTVITAEISGKPPTEKVDNDVLEADTPNVAEKKPDSTSAELHATSATSDVGVAEPTKSEKITQSEQVEAENQLQIQSRKVLEEKTIVVAKEDTPNTNPEHKVAVTSAAQILILKFMGKGVEITADAEAEMLRFLEENKDALRGAKLTAWSFFDPQSTAVSQAKRKAYFRVLSVRNVLINSGFDGESLTINVRPAPTEEEINQVRVFVNGQS